MNDNFRFVLGDSQVLIHAPHGGTEITELAYSSLVIDQAEVAGELLAMTDAHTDKMASDIAVYAWSHGAAGKTANMVINHLSRLVIDPERFPDEREEMNTVGMGAVYTHGSQRQQIRVTDPDSTQRLIDRYFTPYADAVEGAVEDILNKHGRAVIVDLHSYPSRPLPYELHADGERPDVCIGYDDYHISHETVQIVRKKLEDAGYRVGFNSPFAGTYVPLKFYGKDDRVTSLMLEIRRDVYMNEETGSLDREKYHALIEPLGQIIDFLNGM